MLAVVGLVIQEYARLPGSIDLDGSSFEAVPNGISAIAAVPAVGWAQIVAAIAYFELFGWRQREGSTPGDFGFGSKVFGEEINGTEKEVDLKTKEIQHGRLAMLGVSDLIVNDLLRPAVGETISVIQHF
jgi:Chlorophyll A-B binding protein